MRRLVLALFLSLAAARTEAQWPQVGGNPAHTGSVKVAAQPLLHILSDIVYEPFIAQEQAASSGAPHYQVPLVSAPHSPCVSTAGRDRCQI